ncbi:hypothetical protein BDZ85DRAFT_279828 [Elsinoe ampelina]|uniref:Metallo-beta-lactamase domain-containing protein n=1 Tax=Elsinoe ampelina TaxID=302913 RepID=A0A6A6GKY6_9PEZI|nr:hypothetical protein BDZ85DRAFT_279828 [Elsinoe ampelina]
MQWVQETLGKNVTHIWPSQHHHDHSLGVRDYVRVGASIIALDDTQEYHSGIPGIPTTAKKRCTNDQPGRQDASHLFHSADESYAFITPTNPGINSTVAVLDADHVTPSLDTTLESAAPMELVDQMAKDGVTSTATLTSAHEELMPVTRVIRAVDYQYPELSATGFKYLRLLRV